MSNSTTLTQEFILHGNDVIALFVGCRKQSVALTHHKFFDKDFNEIFPDYYKGPFLDELYKTGQAQMPFLLFCTVEFLHFHDQYNWLMPAYKLAKERLLHAHKKEIIEKVCAGDELEFNVRESVAEFDKPTAFAFLVKLVEWLHKNVPQETAGKTG